MTGHFSAKARSGLIELTEVDRGSPRSQSLVLFSDQQADVRDAVVLSGRNIEVRERLPRKNVVQVLAIGSTRLDLDRNLVQSFVEQIDPTAVQSHATNRSRARRPR